MVVVVGPRIEVEERVVGGHGEGERCSGEGAFPSEMVEVLGIKRGRKLDACRRIPAQHALYVGGIGATLGAKETFRGLRPPVDLVATTHPGKYAFPCDRVVEPRLTNVLGKRLLFR